jgi:xylan 1,4-beta-xylosidase
MTAEGGTGEHHAVTLARCPTIDGTYEVYPENPILTSSHKFDVTLWKSGHASIVETQTNEWYMVHLCSRPLMPRQMSPLGRETSIQKVVWNEDGWLRLADGGNTPYDNVSPPALSPYSMPVEAKRHDFNDVVLPLHFQSLRVPFDESWVTLTARPGFLRLIGRESLSSMHRQSMVARRVQSFTFEATTCLEFHPEDFQQTAGLICYYNTNNYYYLHMTRDAQAGLCLAVMSNTNGNFRYPLPEYVPLGEHRKVYLKAFVNKDSLLFCYSIDGIQWKELLPLCDFAILSDENATQSGEWGFTGAFVGLCCQDLSGRHLHADFDWFEYSEE